MQLINFILVAISIIMLWKGADWLVEAASNIAYTLGISDLVIGLTVVAMGTSAPEFAVSITAALSGKSSISIGNVIGSNIFNLGFILGGTACFKAIQTTPIMLWRDGLLLLFSTTLLYFILFGFNLTPVPGQIDRWEGGLLLVILISYLIILFSKKENITDDKITHEKSTYKDWIFLIIGIFLVVSGGHLLVEHSSVIARAYGFSEWAIGVTIVAIGTSAPEFATSLVAVYKKRHGIAIGNLMGSDLFNLLGVLGIAAIIQPMSLDPASHSSMMILVVMVALVLLLMRTGWRISRREGLLLIMLNIIRWWFDLIT